MKLNTVERGNFRIIRTDGSVEEIVGTPTFDKITELTKITVFDTVNLRNGCVMLVDDLGHVGHLKPLNVEATKLYHAVCIPGTTHVIRGDVAIVMDADFGDDE